ncbi:sigma-70 family RNA polymerase sigma factor [Isoptericola sp. NPDC019693]|uniref:sigma-70 family RNA polymerase sigma factor n=1 Tax=Isoptericola sp. NPDC019693 TaxID=3364009 RepID=UPI0037A1987D
MDGTADLVVRAQGGDRVALGELLGAHLPLVRGVVARGLGDDGACAADVDDVVQETMLRAMTSLGAVRDPARFRSWLLAIAYRQMQDHHRARRGRPVPDDPALTRVADPEPSPDVRATVDVVAADQRRGLVAAGRWLDPAHQGVLGLWWQEACGELGRGDLARALGVGRRHAAVRVQRMRAQLATARGIGLALDAVPRCAGLDRAAAGWDGTPSPLWRKRLDRHVRDCPACSGLAAALVPPERLVPAIGLVAVPAGAAEETVRGLLDAGAPAAHGWWHALADQLRDGWDAVVARPVAAVTATAVVVAGGGAAVTTLVLPGPDRPAHVVVPSTAPDPSSPVDQVAAPATEPPATEPPATEPPPDGPTSGVPTADLYVAPDGSDAGDGSWARPFATVAHAVSVVRPGQVIALRGGTHRVEEPVSITTDGAPGARITLSGYRDERAVLDLAGVPADEWPLVQEADRWTVQDLEVRGSKSHGYLCVSCSDGVFQRLRVHANTRSGLELRGAGTVGNVVRDSAFYDNHDDSSGGDAGLGLGVKFGSGAGNVVERNRFYDNADDGVDLGEFASPVTLRGNESFRNGIDRWGIAGWHGNGGGYTLGGGDEPPAVAHVVEGNVAWGNGHHGFADGGNGGAIRLVGNTARDNGAAGFFLETAAAVLRDNTTSGNDVAAKLGDAVVASGNSWPLAAG